MCLKNLTKLFGKLNLDCGKKSKSNDKPKLELFIDPRKCGVTGGFPIVQFKEHFDNPYKISIKKIKSKYFFLTKIEVVSKKRDRKGYQIKLVWYDRILKGGKKMFEYTKQQVNWKLKGFGVDCSIYYFVAKLCAGNIMYQEMLDYM